MGWFLKGNKFYISTNCTGVVATISLTLVIFSTLLILKYASPLPTAHKGRVREYFIAAEEQLWNYTPLYSDPMTGAHWNGSVIHSGRKRDLGTPYAPYNHYDLGTHKVHNLRLKCARYVGCWRSKSDRSYLPEGSLH